MRRYEQILILDSDLSENERSPVFERLKELIPQYDGFLVKMDEWGVKKLAYEIKKKPRGFYTLIDFCGSGDLVNEMERFFRIDDRVLKYMTVLLEKEADIESLKAEIAERETKEAEEAAARAQIEAASKPEIIEALEEAVAAAPESDTETGSDDAAKTPPEPDAEAISEEAAEAAPTVASPDDTAGEETTEQTETRKEE